MIKKFIFTLLIAQQSIAQSYAPPAGQIGSTAIHKDSSIIIGWATDCKVTRGYQNIADQSLGFADYGDSSVVSGVADGANVVSLGDGGSAIVTFSGRIINGPGPDFAIFENSFSETFLELAFVEVSSDGVKYYRFPAVSETQADIQIGGFGTIDCRYIHNFAGKYKANYGTPFDLEDLIDSVGLDLNNINYVKIIDVVGSIDVQYGSQDYLGNLVNDPFPTPFASSGFDLDAMGIIHQAIQGVENVHSATISIYPNPTNEFVNIKSVEQGGYVLLSAEGRVVKEGELSKALTLNLTAEKKGVYLLRIITESGVRNQQIIKL